MSAGTRIRVERLSLRLRGVPVETARAAVHGLGAELAERLAETALDARPGTRALGDLPLGRVGAPSGASAAALRSTVAGEVAGAISRRARGEAR